jgi:hypothetical protein
MTYKCCHVAVNDLQITALPQQSEITKNIFHGREAEVGQQGPRR